MKHILLFTTFALSSAISAAQAYWQQNVHTKIDVALDDRKHILRGYEELTYTNNSPDTLLYIYIHLWPNAYSHDHTRYAEQQYRNGKKDFYYAGRSERGYIDSIQFTIDGKDVDYFYGENTPDIARINLPQPLLPGHEIKIATPFRVKIPKVFSRLGHTGQAYFISQWFPKPAVYDRKGWHPLPYLDNGEFYSEIGSYEVSIRLPANYVVMGTGNIQDESEIRWLDSLAATPLPNDTLYRKHRPQSSDNYKTVRFKEDNVHDFAWFADKRWVVRKDTVVSPGSGNMITTWSAFLPSYQKQWIKANQYLKEAVTYYGKWVGPYPYRTIKAVQGDMNAGGGMEYPTITIIDRNQGDRTTIIHEAGHNWFYGILATNERDHAWMDEGLNTFYEQKTTRILNDTRKRKDTTADIAGINVALSVSTIAYQLAASGMDQATDQTSENFKKLNYGIDVYYKTALLLEWLEGYMGKEAFEAGMHDYYNTWKHRHPYPEDFRAIMQKHSGKPIDWFFEEALKTDRLMDFSITGVRTNNGTPEVRIKNKTDMSLPVSIQAYKGDSLLVTESLAPFTGSTGITLPPEASSWTKISIAPYVADGRKTNNEYRKNGPFHRSGLKPASFIGLNKHNKHRVFILPAVGYNVYDGIGAGLLLHNLTWPETKFKYAIAPLYSFRSKQFTGAASLGYNWYPKQTFKEIMLQADVKSFDYNETQVNRPEVLFARYYKIAPSVSFTLKQPNAASPVTRTFMLKGYAISEDAFDFNLDPADSLYKPSLEQQQNYYGLLRYTHQNQRPFNPFGYSAEAQLGKDFVKINLEGKLRIDYHAKNKALHVRAYAGKFFNLNTSSFASERYYLNSTFTGLTDYLYDDTYIGRSETEGFAARQISIREGGMKIPTFRYLSSYGIGRSDNWMASINLKTDLPLKQLPVRLFMDVVTFAEAGKLNPSGNKVLFAGGVEIYLFDVANIYIPLVRSKDYNDYRKSITGKTSLLDGITFSINLQNINWLKAPSGIFKLAGY